MIAVTIDEIDTFVKQRLERLVADMDFVPREEFEAVKAMAAKAREENDELKKQIARAGHVLVKEYIDDGYSGTMLDRPALEALRKNAKGDGLRRHVFPLRRPSRPQGRAPDHYR